MTKSERMSKSKRQIRRAHDVLTTDHHCKIQMTNDEIGKNDEIRMTKPASARRRDHANTLFSLCVLCVLCGSTAPITFNSRPRGSCISRFPASNNPTIQQSNNPTSVAWLRIPVGAPLYGVSGGTIAAVKGLLETDQLPEQGVVG